MNAAYIVTDMTVAQVDRAFPLANGANPTTTLSDWRRFCQQILAARSEGSAAETLLVCGNALGYLKGLCLARISQTQAGRVLDVPMCVVATVVDEEGVRSALYERLQALALAVEADQLILPS